MLVLVRFVGTHGVNRTIDNAGVNMNKIRLLSLTPAPRMAHTVSTTTKPALAQPRTSQDHIKLTEKYCAHNYHPLPVVIKEGKGVWVTDVKGRRYMDFLSGYAAASFGHSNPRLIQAAQEQLNKITLTTRAFHNDKLGEFAKALTELCDMEVMLPANGGADAVEGGLKIARKWGYKKKGIPTDQAVIVVCENNFHGRPISISGFSDDPGSREGFGPYPAGFIKVPFGDASALEKALQSTQNIAGFLFEPIQGEAGVHIPPKGYLEKVRQLCTQYNVLMIADEVQAGLGRTGKTLACDHENVKPDILILAKALSGGLFPSAAILSSWNIMDVIKPGQHGSTFGGNPLAAAVGLEVVKMLQEGTYQANATRMGSFLAENLRTFTGVTEVRQRGLWLGIQIDPNYGTAPQLAEELMTHGVLCKSARPETLRFSPSLGLTHEEAAWALKKISEVLDC